MGEKTLTFWRQFYDENIEKNLGGPKKFCDFQNLIQ